MRKRFVAILLIAVFIVAAIWWWRTLGKKDLKAAVDEVAPEMEVVSMNITDMDDKTVRMSTTSVLRNKVPVEFTIDSVQYSLFIDSAEMLQSTYPKQIVLKKSDSSVIQLPVELNVGVLRNVIKKFEAQNRDSANYTLKAKFIAGIPVGGKRNFYIETTRRLPAIREIKVTPGSVDIEKFGFRQSALGMQLRVKNNNVFPISIRNGSYRVNIEDDFEAEGRLEKFLTIPAKGSETVDMSMLVKTAKLPKLGWKTLFKDESTKFYFSFTGTLMSDIEMINNSKMKMEANGTLDEIKDLAEKP